MDSRREFIRKAALLSGSGLFAGIPSSVLKAMAIDPAPGSTYEDAEHVVILMQENRSFDHCFGSLRGVRGFNDHRAITLPSGHPVWLQANKAGETYVPFRLDLKNSKATWMSSLPHSWENQVDARNNGKYDGWLEAKRPGIKEYANMPLTLGYYTREDIPFYYALADAFTVCDQHFCSSLTGTTPNRLYLWSGTIRPPENPDSHAAVRNSDVDYGVPAHWKTFPERLEENGISWRIYQNELSMPSGLEGEAESWLANFTDNPIEWFPQYNVGFAKGYMSYLEKLVPKLKAELAAMPADDAKRAKKQEALDKAVKAQEQWNPANYEKLSAREKALHEKAFTTNINDPFYHELDTLEYEDGGKKQSMKAPKGDVLHQFREDVKSGKLPTVSWLVAPENFSDHPTSPWYGAWYVSEVMDILTQNPEVWKKTIFILTYDENDGCYDHVPPFVAPKHDDVSTGAVSPGINVHNEWVTKEQEKRRSDIDDNESRESPIGLGYRVPFVVASPWSRGGKVNSQVFDHTSPLQFLEKFLSKKTGKKIEETNISSWRRAVCGDLTSVFTPYNGEKIGQLKFIEREAFLETVNKAQFKPVPDNYKKLDKDELRDPQTVLAKQEPGTRPSCALPYELEVKEARSAKAFTLTFAAHRNVFNDKAAGAPFTVYAMTKYKGQEMLVRNYAVAPGEQVTGEWELDGFAGGLYHLRVYGPNGFYREFKGNGNDPVSEIKVLPSPRKDKRYTPIHIEFPPAAKGKRYIVQVTSKEKTMERKVGDGGTGILLDLEKASGWYDFHIKIEGDKEYSRHYAGRTESGAESISDPAMA